MADGAKVTGKGFGFEYRFWFELDDRVCLGMFIKRNKRYKVQKGRGKYEREVYSWKDKV